MHVTTYAQINTHTQWPSIAMFLKHVLKTCLLIYNWNFTFMWRTVGCWFFPGSMFQQQERNTGECKRMKVKWRSIPRGKPNTHREGWGLWRAVYISHKFVLPPSENQSGQTALKLTSLTRCSTFHHILLVVDTPVHTHESLLHVRGSIKEDSYYAPKL